MLDPASDRDDYRSYKSLVSIGMVSVVLISIIASSLLLGWSVFKLVLWMTW